ncbi:MAG: oxidoreductase family protein [Clostridiales bacterium]
MNDIFQKITLKATNSKKIYKIEEIQNLWSGYGKIIRYGLDGSNIKSVVVKNVCLPKNNKSSRKYALSHQRKINSYKVEMSFYKNWSNKCNNDCKVPTWYALEWLNDEFLMVFEDLDDSGFGKRKTSVTWNEVRTCLKWLANFHATFMGEKPEKLWSKGTYWHLETRPDELKALKDIKLKNAAKTIDQKLQNCKFKTLVHGDAKLENFCFSSDGNNVATVDFQYTGGGCGMKDLAYFIGSCFYEDEYENWETEILEFYFQELKKGLDIQKKILDFTKLEREWRKLYPLAWTDFHRFIKGWGSYHFAKNSYSERIARKVISEL